MKHYTKQDTAMQLRQRVEAYIDHCYGHDSEESQEFYWRWNAPDATWTGRHRLVMEWMHREQQAARNGVLRNGGGG